MSRKKCSPRSVLEMWKRMDAMNTIKAYWTAHLAEGLKMSQRFRQAEAAEARERESRGTGRFGSSLTRRFRGTGRSGGADTAAPAESF